MTSTITAMAGIAYRPAARRSSAALIVFAMSIAIVSGPTPPGTGVIAPATSATSGCTSPTSTDPCARTARAADALREKSLCATLGIGHEVDADVDDRRARLDERSAARSPGRPSAATRMSAVAATAGKILRARMANRHGRVAMQQKHRDRLADDVAAADDDRMLAGDVDAAALQQFDDAGRRARDQIGAILHQPPDVRRASRRRRPSPDRSRRTPAAWPHGPSESGSGACTRIPSVAGSALSCVDRATESRRATSTPAGATASRSSLRRPPTSACCSRKSASRPCRRRARCSSPAAGRRARVNAAARDDSSLRIWRGDGGAVENSRRHGLFGRPFQLFQRLRAAEHDEVIAGVKDGARPPG